MGYYEKHIFICENQRGEGERQSCGAQNSPILKYIKSKAKSYAKEPKGTKSIRVQRAGCFDRCEEGPLIVSYPEEKWFSLKTIEDADRFLQHYIGDGDETSIQDLMVEPSP